MRATARLIQGCTLTALMAAAAVLPGGAAGAEPLRELPAHVSMLDQSWSDAMVKFTAAAGRSEYLVVTNDESTVTFDNSYQITPGVGCVNAAGDLTIAICSRQTHSVVAVRAYLGDGDDTVALYTDIRVDDAEVHGGSGNDLLKSAPSSKSYVLLRLFGEAGDDNLVDELGSEHQTLLYGGDGNDHLSCTNPAVNGTGEMYGGSGADTFAGRCLADYSDRTTHVNVSVDGIANDGAPGEGDNVQTSISGVLGGSGDDVLSSKVATFLVGYGGADWLIGSDFDDRLWGYDGAGGDLVIGGSGNDSCSADAGDNVGGCEY